MKHYNVRERLIDRTVEVIASEGLDKTTTKGIVTGTGINEAYIYRFFKDKEDLLACMFDKLDSELAEVATRSVEVMYDRTFDYEIRSRLYFRSVWRFILGKQDRCKAFIRYYYSPYFKKYSSEEHVKKYAELVEILSKVFKEESNVWMLLNHMLDVILSFGIKVFDGEVPDDEDTEEHVFRLVYHSVKQYFREEKGEKTEQ